MVVVRVSAVRCLLFVNVKTGRFSDTWLWLVFFGEVRPSRGQQPGKGKDVHKVAFPCP
jgi:hypothetical protein